MEEEIYRPKDFKEKFVIPPNPNGTNTTTVDRSEAAQLHRKAMEVYDARQEKQDVDLW